MTEFDLETIALKTGQPKMASKEDLHLYRTRVFQIFDELFGMDFQMIGEDGQIESLEQDLLTKQLTKLNNFFQQNSPVVQRDILRTRVHGMHFEEDQAGIESLDLYIKSIYNIRNILRKEEYRRRAKVEKS